MILILAPRTHEGEDRPTGESIVSDTQKVSNIHRRGFASMDREKQRAIASKGGRTAHQKGTAHEWTSESARSAGKKGGLWSRKRAAEQAKAATIS